MRRRLLLAAVPMICVAGCGGESSLPTETKTITVVVADSVPLRVYTNYDDESCWAGDILTGRPKGGSLPAITVENEDGRILATAEAPLVGGSFGDTGCRVSVVLKDLEPASFYRITLDTNEGQFEAVMDGSKSVIDIAVD